VPRTGIRGFSNSWIVVAVVVVVVEVAVVVVVVVVVVAAAVVVVVVVVLVVVVVYPSFLSSVQARLKQVDYSVLLNVFMQPANFRRCDLKLHLS